MKIRFVPDVELVSLKEAWIKLKASMHRTGWFREEALVKVEEREMRLMCQFTRGNVSKEEILKNKIAQTE